MGTVATVRHLVYVEPGRVEWQEAPDPTPEAPTSAVVRPLAVARCDLDPHMAGLGIFPGPFPVGHETVAEVVEVGDDVRRVRPGDRVLVPFQLSCGVCDACATGRFGGCRTYKARAGGAFGFGEAGGGHGGAVADLLAVPAADHLLLDAPDLAPTVLATLPDNVVDAYRAVGPPLAEAPGADVLVVGGLAASIGLYAVGWAVALGAGSVRYADDDPERLAAAAALGAAPITLAVDEAWPHHLDPRARITVDNTGDEDGLATTIRSTDVYGRCTSVVIHFTPTTPVPLLEMYTRGITLHVSRADSRRYLPEVVEHVAAGRFDPAAVPTTVVPWDRADEAWLEPATKLVLDRSG